MEDFTLGRTVADLCVALVGCLERLGGVPERIVHDNDASIVAEGAPRVLPRRTNTCRAVHLGVVVTHANRVVAGT